MIPYVGKEEYSITDTTGAVHQISVFVWHRCRKAYSMFKRGCDTTDIARHFFQSEAISSRYIDIGRHIETGKPCPVSRVYIRGHA